MKKTLTAVVLATSMLPTSNTSNAESENDLQKLNSDNVLHSKSDEKSSDSNLQANEDNILFVEDDNNYLNKDTNLELLKRINNGSEHISEDASFSLNNFNSRLAYSGTDFKMSSSGKVINVQSNDTLNVRNSDSTKGLVLFKLKPNSLVTVTEQTNNGWYKISYNGNSGFVNPKYIQLTNTSVNTTNFSGHAQTTLKTYLKELPYAGSKSLIEIPSNTTFDKVALVENNWAKVTYNNKTGFISPDAFKTYTYTVSDIKLDGVVYNVGTSNLNVRKEANTFSSIIGTLKNNDRVTVTGVTSNGWYRVDINGTVGYVSKSYIKEYVPQTTVYTVVNSAINLRTSASWSGTVYKAVKVGEKVDVISINGDWATIYMDGQTLYAPSKYLSPSTQTPSTPEVTPPAESKPEYTVTDTTLDGITYNLGTSLLNVRKEPNTSAQVLTQLSDNTRVKVTGITSNGWYRVDINGTVGYVSKSYIKEYVPQTTVYTVVNSDINLRTSASWSGTVYKAVKVGEKVDVISINGDWATIYMDGQTLYAPSKYLSPSTQTPSTPEATPPAESKPEYTVTDTTLDGITYNLGSDTLSVRKEPYASAQELTKLNNNTRVKVTGITSNGWYRVDINGTVGYASKSYIKEYVPQTTVYTVVNGSINIRTSASWSGTVYKTIKVGEKVDVISINGDWATIYMDGQTLYAPSKYLSPSTQTPSTPEVTPPAESKPEYTVTDTTLDGITYNLGTSLLNIRKEPNTSAQVLTQLADNTRVKVTGITSNGWYRVDINGTVGYASKSYIKEYVPQTTVYTVINGSINIRTSASWSGTVYKTIKVGEKVDVISINGDWATIYMDGQTLYAPSSYLSPSTQTPSTPSESTLYTKYNYTLAQYIKAQADRCSHSESTLEEYINPEKCNKFEFLRLNVFRNLDVTKLNNMLKAQNAGVLMNKGQAILDTAKKYNIDPLYFVSQSILETGYGKSTLAKGVTITEIANPDKPIKDKNGNITGYEMIQLANPTTVYNLYGIGAYDNLPTMPNRALVLGTTYAYNQGWTSIEKAIDGAGAFVSNNYINSTKYKQNTLYKMRFNPNSTYLYHQYATNPGYARKIALIMDKYQDLYLDTNFKYDKPLFIGMSEYSLKSASNLDLSNYKPIAEEDVVLRKVY